MAPRHSVQTPLDRVLDALRSHGTEPRRNGDGFTCRCPAHEDRNPSLSIDEGRDGAAVVNCHAGCPPERVLEVIGLQMSDLFPPREPAPDRLSMVEAYEYVDDIGYPMYEVVRYVKGDGTKTFRQRRPDGKGGWIWGLAQTPRVLYRLDRIFGAAKDGATIYVVEGEKDVHSIEKYSPDTIATTNPMGVGGGWRDQYTESLIGANVIIVADRDEAGRGHARAVAKSLKAAGIEVSIVEAAAGKDVTDHLAEGLTLADLVPMVDEHAEELEPTAVEAEAPPAGDVFKLNLMTARQIADLPPPDEADYLLGPLLVRGQRLVIGGHTGEGKTTLVLQLIAAACSGTETLGLDAPNRCRALVIDAEQGIHSIRKKILEAGIENLDVTYAVHPDGLTLDQSPEHYNALGAELETGAYDIVVADPLYKLHAGESNDEQQAIALMRMFDRWRTDNRFCLVIPVHCRKPIQGQGAKLTIHELFGSGAYTRGAEVVIGITRVSDGYARLHWLKDRDGNLPGATGTAWGLIFKRDEGGFRRDPNDTGDTQTTSDKILYALAGASEPLTIRQLDALGCGKERTIRKHLAALHSQGKLVEHGTTKNNEKLYALPLEGDVAAMMWEDE